MLNNQSLKVTIPYLGEWHLDFSEVSDLTRPPVLPAAIFFEAAFAEVFSPAEGKAGRGITSFATPPSTFRAWRNNKKRHPLVARGPGEWTQNVLDSAGISRFLFLQQRRCRSRLWVRVRPNRKARSPWNTWGSSHYMGNPIRRSTSFRTRNTRSSSGTWSGLARPSKLLASVVPFNQSLGPINTPRGARTSSLHAVRSRRPLR